MCILSHVWFFVTLWTVAHQAPLSMGFSRPEYWSGLPFHFPEDLPDPGINLHLLHCKQILYATPPFISLSIISSRSIHVVSNGKISFLLWLICHIYIIRHYIYIYIYIYMSFLIHSSIDGHLGWLHILAIVNNAAMTISVCVCIYISDFVVFSMQIPQSGIA